MSYKTILIFLIISLISLVSLINNALGADYGGLEITPEKIIINRSLIYGLFEEKPPEHIFKYEDRDWKRVLPDYFAWTKLLESKVGFVSAAGENIFDPNLKDGNYKLYTEFDHISAPSLMNYVTVLGLIIDVVTTGDRKNKLLSELKTKVEKLGDKINNLAIKSKKIFDSLDVIIEPLALVGEIVMYKENGEKEDLPESLEKGIEILIQVNNTLNKVEGILDAVIKITGELDIKYPYDESTYSALFKSTNFSVDNFKKELSKGETWKNLGRKYFFKMILNPFSFERILRVKKNGITTEEKFSVIEVKHNGLNLGKFKIEPSNFMPIDYVAQIFAVSAEDKDDWKLYKKDYRRILLYTFKSKFFRATIKKFENMLKEPADLGNFIEAVSGGGRKIVKGQKLAIIKYLLKESKEMGEEALEQFITDLAYYLVPGASQAKTLVKGGKLANKGLKFAYDFFTAPRVIPFSIENGSAKIAFFNDLYKYSFFVSPNGKNLVDPYNKVADATYDSYFLYGTGYEENFQPFDINYRPATLVAQGVSYSYDIFLGAYNNRGDGFSSAIDEYDKAFDEPVFKVKYLTRKFENDNFDSEPSLFISDIGVVNIEESECLTFPFREESGDYVKEIDEDSNDELDKIVFKICEGDDNTDINKFTYVSYKDIFSYNLEKQCKGDWPWLTEDIWKECKIFESYKNNHGLYHITPGIFQVHTEIQMLPPGIEKEDCNDENKDIAKYGDDHLLFVMAGIRNRGDDPSEKVIPRLEEDPMGFKLGREQLVSGEIDQKDYVYIIEINFTEKTPRDLFFSIYDTSKEYKKFIEEGFDGTDIGVSIKIPKGTQSFKTFLPDNLFIGEGKYAVFYHDSITEAYSNYMNIPLTKIHLDLYRDRAENLDSRAIRRIIGYFNTFEKEKQDIDRDEMNDRWEMDFFGNYEQDGSADSDDDGLTDLEEYNNETNPLDIDTDKDGMPDGWEIQNGTDPLLNDSTGDLDSDGLLNIDEYYNNSDANNPDTDGDKLSDYDEFFYNTDPNNQDTDGDSLTDYDESKIYIKTIIEPREDIITKDGFIKIISSGDISFDEEVGRVVIDGKELDRNYIYDIDWSSKEITIKYLYDSYDNTGQKILDINFDNMWKNPEWKENGNGVKEWHLDWDDFIKPIKIKIYNTSGRKVVDTYYPFNDIVSNNDDIPYYSRPVMMLWLEGIISGYPEANIFRPGKSVNRAEFIKMTTLSAKFARNIEKFKSYRNYLSDTFSDDDEKEGGGFDDDRWFLPFIGEAYEAKIIDGYPDKTVKPAERINRAEASKILLNSFDFNDQFYNHPFEDVKKDDWFDPFVANCYNYEIMIGYSDGEFKPSKKMVRAEAAQAIFNAICSKKSND